MMLTPHILCGQHPRTSSRSVRTGAGDACRAAAQKDFDRCAEMQAELDPQRLEQELVILAQKSESPAEELDRLRSYAAVEVRLRAEKLVRQARWRSDFLMQELTRRPTPSGSKAFDSNT